jgi:hypothetical protein
MIYIFYAATVNTPRSIHMGIKVYDVIINYFFFSNAMLMQKSKYAEKKKII